MEQAFGRQRALALFRALTGCVTTSEIIARGAGIYAVVGHASGSSHAGRAATEALKKAQEFCSARGLTLALRSTEFSGSAHLGGESATVTFACVSPPAGA
jgi:hypothetical protein